MEEEPALIKSGHTSHPGTSLSPPARSDYSSPAGFCHKKCEKYSNLAVGTGCSLT